MYSVTSNEGYFRHVLITYLGNAVISGVRHLYFGFPELLLTRYICVIVCVAGFTGKLTKDIQSRWEYDGPWSAASVTHFCRLTRTLASPWFSRQNADGILDYCRK